MEYIRFGEIPKDEKSAIWNNSNECIGYEAGVSVYEAHKNQYDQYVPVIPYPMTETTLNDYIYHLNYFRGHKYLVTGDYMTIGTNHEPLIHNVKIIKEL